MSFIERLIEEVRKNEFLYNSKNKNFKRINLKDATWLEIGKKLNSSVSNCKKKWKGLRDSYRKNQKLFETDPKSFKKWKYYDQLSFLSEIPRQKRTPSNLSPTYIKEDTEQDPLDIFCSSGIVDTKEIEEILNMGDKTSTSEKSNDEIYKDFKKTLDLTKKTLENISKPKTSTNLLFNALAFKIEEENLPKDIINKIEYDIIKIVYEYIESYKDN